MFSLNARHVTIGLPYAYVYADAILLGPNSWPFWLSAFHMADAMRDLSHTTQTEASFFARSTRVGRIR